MEVCVICRSPCVIELAFNCPSLVPHIICPPCAREMVSFHVQKRNFKTVLDSVIFHFALECPVCKTACYHPGGSPFKMLNIHTDSAVGVPCELTCAQCCDKFKDEQEYVVHVLQQCKQNLFACSLCKKDVQWGGLCPADLLARHVNSDVCTGVRCPQCVTTGTLTEARECRESHVVREYLIKKYTDAVNFAAPSQLPNLIIDVDDRLARGFVHDHLLMEYGRLRDSIRTTGRRVRRNIMAPDAPYVAGGGYNTPRSARRYTATAPNTPPIDLRLSSAIAAGQDARSFLPNIPDSDDDMSASEFDDPSLPQPERIVLA